MKIQPHLKKNMALTTKALKAFYIGGTFFLIRLILAIIYGLYAQSVKIESNSSYKINVIISIILAVGALIDLWSAYWFNYEEQDTSLHLDWSTVSCW